MKMCGMKISSISQMRDMDRRAIEEFGIPDTILMENAGNAVSNVILETYRSVSPVFASGDFSNLNFAIFCGSGNNGGDGFVVARKLFSLGAGVRVFFLGKREKLGSSALGNYEILYRLGVDVIESASEGFLAMAEDYLKRCDGVVDAILGTGIAREVSGLYRDVIKLINRYGRESGRSVFSVDIPSGVNGDTGRVMGVAVKASYTVTFGLPKLGNILYPGYEYCGKLYLTHISFPPDLYNAENLQVEINVPSVLPPRNPDGHKGSFGDVLFIAGAKNYYGAPLFSALSFMRAGGGYARLATPESVAPFVSMRGSEIVMLPLKETATGSISYGNLERLLETAGGVDFVVIGPGLSLNEETARLVRDFVTGVEKPVLIDGDGLSAIAGGDGRISDILRRGYPTILTPHPGEASRLIGWGAKEVVSDKLGALNEIFRLTAIAKPGIVVLKGAHSLIGVGSTDESREEDGGFRRVFVNPSGNSGMATAGSGDVLTGVIAAMFGLGLDAVEAVKAGVFIHGLAGDIAAERMGEDSVTASSVMEFLPEALKSYRENYFEVFRDYYGCVRMV